MVVSWTVSVEPFVSVFPVVPPIHFSQATQHAAQPSHDRAAAIPFDDFDTNVRLAGIRDRTFSMVCSALYATTKTTETLITL